MYMCFRRETERNETANIENAKNNESAYINITQDFKSSDFSKIKTKKTRETDAPSGPSVPVVTYADLDLITQNNVNMDQLKQQKEKAGVTYADIVFETKPDQGAYACIGEDVTSSKVCDVTAPGSITDLYAVSNK